MQWFRTKCLICIFWDVCRPQTGMTNTPRNHVSAQNVLIIPLKVVIFRARFFKAQHAMISSVVVATRRFELCTHRMSYVLNELCIPKPY